MGIFNRGEPKPSSALLRSATNRLLLASMSMVSYAFRQGGAVFKFELVVFAGAGSARPSLFKESDRNGQKKGYEAICYGLQA